MASKVMEMASKVMARARPSGLEDGRNGERDRRSGGGWAAAWAGI